MNTLAKAYSASPWTRPLARSVSICTPPGFDMNAPCEKTAEELVAHLSNTVIGGPRTYDPESYNRQREALMDLLPASQDELPVRSMLDSFDQCIIPLGSDKQLRDRYLTHFGGVRVGRLLEDMDIFAVSLVFKHMLNPRTPADSTQSPFSIVTALVDRIDVTNRIQADQDIKLMGHVTWVGRSSAESTIQLWQLREGSWVKVTEATFLMAVRNPTNSGSSFVNPLAAETETERKLFDRGERSKIARYALKTDSLFNHPPTEAEKKQSMAFELSPFDHKLLKFGKLFLERFMRIEVSLPLNDALDLAWQTLAECFEPAELLMKQEFIDRYYPQDVHQKALSAEEEQAEAADEESAALEIGG